MWRQLKRTQSHTKATHAQTKNKGQLKTKKNVPFLVQSNAESPSGVVVQILSTLVRNTLVVHPTSAIPDRAQTLVCGFDQETLRI